ncbi:MAG TPA: transketolase [Candidatus Babeliales bacterium]|jgi:transketolase|nr:transketolase [Candidatus Babeliales bacterium]
MQQQLHHFLANKAFNLRVLSLQASAAAGSGHPTSCLSAADIVSVLFFHVLRFDPQHFEHPDSDRFILSKGHASALLYAVWEELGIITHDALMQYRQFNSILEGHPTRRFAYTEAATGSLGIGLSIGVGQALAARIDKRDYTVFVLLGDGELAEGSVWEAAELASHNKLNNLIAVVDCNRLGQSEPTMAAHHCGMYASRFSAFGFYPIEVDGHNIDALIAAFNQAKQNTEQPTVIIAKTFKGYGIDGIENQEGYHGKALSSKEIVPIINHMKKRFADVADNPGTYQWQPAKLPVIHSSTKNMPTHITVPPSTYKKDEQIATRKAFGTTLAKLGTASEHIVVCDGDVKNSTYTQDFQKMHPNRFVQCFIAEQNMVSMAVGMERRGKIPFVSTFGAFFCRAHDQIRMAAIGQSTLRLVGSHAGVSIGQDGPSQMALEDIAMMRALPESIVLYPSDAVSAHALTICMTNYHDGISYLRTTRMETPVIYTIDTSFTIGGCNVLREYKQATACIIAAGITLHEALKAHDELIKQNIYINIIDLYSIKPIDAQTIIQIAVQSNNRIITVEDHYAQGGIGEAVRSALADSELSITSLAVSALPRSGKPEELLAWAGIDAAAIIKTICS